MAGELSKSLKKKMPIDLIDAVKKIDSKEISVERVINFILNAQDSEGKTAWSYNFSNYFSNDDLVKDQEVRDLGYDNENFFYKMCDTLEKKKLQLWLNRTLKRD